MTGWKWNRMIVVGLLAIGLAVPAWASVCAPLSSRGDTVLETGVDYRPRLDVVDVLESGSSAARPSDEDVLFPISAWNLLEGLDAASFQIITNAQSLVFLPEPGVTVANASSGRPGDGLVRLDLTLEADGLCGPALLGYAAVVPAENQSSVFVDLEGHAGNGLPTIVDVTGAEREAVSPFHGAFSGDHDPFHGQAPLCAEPLAPITDLTTVQSGGLVLELGWTAGDGDATMIRYRTDGRYPTSVFDGELLALFPASEGQWQTLTHANPDVPEYWYAAFNVTLEGETPELGSSLECGSFVTGSVDESVSNEDATWSALKRSYH